MADRGLLQDLETEPESQDLYRSQRERHSHPDLDSSYSNAGNQVVALSIKGGLVVLQYGPPAGGIRMNLFTYRDMIEWLNKPYATPPLIPEPEQLRLALR